MDSTTPVGPGQLEPVTGSGGPPLKILLVAVEVAPFAKVGGLADVAGALPKALRALGHDVRVAMPKYQVIDEARFGLQTRLAALPVPLGDQIVTVRIAEAPLDPDHPIPVYFIDSPHYFDRPEVYAYPDDDERFVLFSRAAVEMLGPLGWTPDVIHCNDWHTGIIPNWLQTIDRQNPALGHAATVFTIHNIAYQGEFTSRPPAAGPVVGVGGDAATRFLKLAGVAAQGLTDFEQQALGGTVNLMGRGIQFADAVNAVSEQYAREIMTPEYGEKLDPLVRSRHDHVFGILNGIDMDVFNPMTDRHIAARYSAADPAGKGINKAGIQHAMHLPVRPDVPLMSAISRLFVQKGFDIMIPALEEVLPEVDAQFILLAIGDPGYEARFKRLAARHPDKVSLAITFDPPLAQRIYAGSDIFLMPSRFEPCGLGQMIAMRYGTVPVVRRTGGLADTVQNYDPATGAGSGFVFDPYTPEALIDAIRRALAAYAQADAWSGLRLHDLSLDWSWERSARKYVALYHKALAFHNAA